MSVTLRMLLLAASVIAVAWILLQIRKFKVKMEDAIFWVFFAAVLLVLAVFPEVSYWLSSKMGFMSPSNLVFLVVIFLLIEKIFTLSIIVSQLEEKISVLSAEVALRSQAADKRIDRREPLETALSAGDSTGKEKSPSAGDSTGREKSPSVKNSPGQKKSPSAKKHRKSGKNRASGNPHGPEGSL